MKKLLIITTFVFTFSSHASNKPFEIKIETPQFSKYYQETTSSSLQQTVTTDSTLQELNDENLKNFLEKALKVNRQATFSAFCATYKDARLYDSNATDSSKPEEQLIAQVTPQWWSNISPYQLKICGASFFVDGSFNSQADLIYAIKHELSQAQQRANTAPDMLYIIHFLQTALNDLTHNTYKSNIIFYNPPCISNNQ